MAEANRDHCKELYPIPIATLVTRLARDLAAGDAVYNIRRKAWWTPDPDVDVGIEHVGLRAGTPAGPASGPHTQLAQNLLMAYLCGGRFMELKTVQILDALELPRPCISVPHVGYNVEWSQELRVWQSAEEYVKGWMLTHMLCSELGPGVWPGPEVIYDLSLGYDLAGIQGEKVTGFIETMKDASGLIEEMRERLRAELPAELAAWAEVEVPAQISGSTTLSTFHGCPADEIEGIAAFTMERHGLHTIIKLNPTLLGFERCQKLLNETLGYDQIRLDPEPFEKDLQWVQLMEMIPRLEAVAAKQGVTLGVKFSNTLVMQSPDPGFGEQEMYMSGAALHALSLTLAAEFREATHNRIPITFSAGIDAKNFSPCVAAGLGPVTSCSDLLKSKGYARMTRYVQNLEKAIKKAGASDVAGLRGTPEAAAQRLTELAAEVRGDKRYTKAKNSKPPKKVGSVLELFNCLTCDICIPVCPNGANFSFPVPEGEHQPGLVRWEGERFEVEAGSPVIIDKRHQIGTTVDACNLCGECDVWCPETGGPYLSKPNVFLSPLSFEDHPERDGFLVSPDWRAITWRREGEIYHYALTEGGARFTTQSGTVDLDGDSAPVSSSGSGEVDLAIAVNMKLILGGLTASGASTWLAPPREA